MDSSYYGEVRSKMPSSPSLSNRKSLRQLTRLFAQYEDRLRKMIFVRLDKRLFGRVDTDDLLQQVYFKAAAAFDAYQVDPIVPPFVWLRTLTRAVLTETHQSSLRRSLAHAPYSTSYSIASHIVQSLSVSQDHHRRQEICFQLKKALDKIDEANREILALRHFEDLTNSDVAQILGISRSAASHRYMCALKRLRTILLDLVPDWDELA